MKAYVNECGKIIIDKFETLSKVAVELGYEEVVNVKDFEEVIETEVIKDGKYLNEEEIKKEFEYWQNILDQACEINKLDHKWSVFAKMKEFLFIGEAKYRGGEKVIPVAFRINEDPIEKVANYYDWYDMWELEFDMISVEDLYYILKKIFDEFIKE